MRFASGLPSHSARLAFWLATLALSALTVANTLPYLSLEPGFAFLHERGALAREPLWRACFYAHVAGGCVCLATGPALAWGGLLRVPAAHRLLGRVYVAAVLGCSAPAALYLALRAQGGLAGRLGFLALDALWIATTTLGVALVARRRIAEHRRWMLRSYALALSALSFRVLHVGLQAAGVGGERSYVVSLWASLALSLVAGEWLARAPAAARSSAAFTWAAAAPRGGTT